MKERERENFSKLQIHRLAKHQVEKHKSCPHCEFKSAFNQKVKRHIDSNHPEHGEKQFFCEHCGKGFIFNDTFKQHCAYECKIKKTSNYTQKYNKARNQKKKSLGLKCDYCDEVFNGSKRAKHHYQTWHPSQPIIAEGYQKFQCDKCNEFFFIEDELQCHLNLDHGVKTEKNYCRRCSRQQTAAAMMSCR